MSGLTDADLATIQLNLFKRPAEVLKTGTLQEYDSETKRVLGWYKRAWTRIGKRIDAHFIAIEEGGRLIVHVFPYQGFATREAAKQHLNVGYMNVECGDAFVEDHGDAGLVLIHQCPAGRIT